MKTENLLIIGGAVVLGGLYLSNKSKKDKANAKALADAQALALADAQALALANAQSQNPKVEPTEDLTGFYNTTEATKKALEVVTKWISLLDSIPKEALKEESKNVIRERVLAEEAKQNKIDYDKALALAKSKNESKFTFKDTTYWTANQEDVRNGSFGTASAVPTSGMWSSAFASALAKLWIPSQGFYYFNPFRYSDENERINNLVVHGMLKSNLSNSNEPKTLGDFIKLIKTQKFSEVYDRLKVAFTELPKSDVNRLIVLLPKYLMMATDNFAYFQTEYEKNPFTIEEQLYLKDINLEQLLSPPRNLQWDSKQRELESYIQAMNN